MTKILHFTLWPFARIFFKSTLKFRVLGLENVTKIKGPVIFVSNHECYFDPFLVSAGIPWFSKIHPVRSLAHDGLFCKSRILTFFLRIYGAFPGRAYKCDESALRMPEKILSNGGSVIIFKEWCYKVNPGKDYIYKVIAALGVKQKVPIIPVFIYGIYDGGLTWKKVFQRKREVCVAYGKPVTPEMGSSEEKIEMLVEKGLLHTKLEFIKSLHEDEKRFWNGYAQFYYYLERAEPYQKLMNDVAAFVPDEMNGRWLDMGSGSGGVVDIFIKKKLLPSFEVSATDIDPTMIRHLEQRFAKVPFVKTRMLDLAPPIDIPNNSLDGVTANLVLPYVTYHHGEIGKKAFIDILKDVHKILRPGGVFIWSTPKKNVNFGRVFAESWKNVFDPRNISHIYYGPAILRQALKIQRKGKIGLYSFLSRDELREVLAGIGFKDIIFKRSMAGQVDIVFCRK